MSEQDKVVVTEPKRIDCTVNVTPIMMDLRAGFDAEKSKQKK